MNISKKIDNYIIKRDLSVIYKTLKERKEDFHCVMYLMKKFFVEGDALDSEVADAIFMSDE